jgi:hypothetical protein
MGVFLGVFRGGLDQILLKVHVTGGFIHISGGFLIFFIRFTIV